MYGEGEESSQPITCGACLCLTKPRKRVGKSEDGHTVYKMEEYLRQATSRSGLFFPASLYPASWEYRWVIFHKVQTGHKGGCSVGRTSPELQKRILSLHFWDFWKTIHYTKTTLNYCIEQCEYYGILGVHCGGYKYYCLLGCSALWSHTQLPLFHRKFLSPSFEVEEISYSFLPWRWRQQILPKQCNYLPLYSETWWCVAW